jgi:hypothetical protein
LSLTKSLTTIASLILFPRGDGEVVESKVISYGDEDE